MPADLRPPRLAPPLTSSRMCRGVTALLLVLTAGPAWSYEEAGSAAMRLGRDVQYLASDQLQGRGVGTEGIDQAADYIRDRYRELGLKSGVEDGSYLQPFEVHVSDRVVEEKTELKLSAEAGESSSLVLGEQFQPLKIGGDANAQGELLFVGYGISAPDFGYDDYAGIDAEGKILVMIRREPQQDDEKSKFKGKEVTQHAYLRNKINLAKKHKAAGILLVNDPHSAGEENRDDLSEPSGFGSRSLGLPFAHVKRDMLAPLLKDQPLETSDGRKLDSFEAVEQYIDETLKPLSQPFGGYSASYQARFEPVKVPAANVIGVLEGNGPLADETIVIGAHYDHLGLGGFGSRTPGRKEVHNGADDNATGTAAVLELARYFTEAEVPPARRIVFICFSGEERGLLGSAYYVNHPVVPLEKTVAMFNFDMIGQLRDEGLTVQGVQLAKQFEQVVDEVTGGDDLKVKVVGRTTGGSDHLPFLRKEIPVMFFFTGLTSTYHTPEDDFETINVAGMAQVTDFAAAVVERVVHAEHRPEFVKPESPRTRLAGLPYLGIRPDPTTTSEGIRLRDVADRSPADKAGMQTGDVLVTLGGQKVTDPQSLARVLQRRKAGDKVKAVLKRGDKQLTVDVELTTAP